MPENFHGRMARWRFYGLLGSLRWIETKLLVIESEIQDGAILEIIGEIREGLERLKSQMLSHRDDWKDHAKPPKDDAIPF